MGLVPAQSEPEHDHRLLLLLQILHPGHDFLAPLHPFSVGGGRDGHRIFDHIAQECVRPLGNRTIQGVRGSDQELQVDDVLFWNPHAVGGLVGPRLPPQLLDQLFDFREVAVEPFHDVNRQPNELGLIDDGALDELADPPGGIRAEPEAARIVELFDGLNQAKVAFFDDVRERQPPIHVALADTDDQSKV